MPPAIAIAGASLAVAAVGTVAQISSASKARKASNKAARYERQRSDLQSALQKRDAVRSARSSYAEAQQNAQNQGVQDSSSAEGGQGSIVSQVNSNLSFLDQYGFYSDQASKAMGQARDAQYEGQIWGQVTGLAEKVYEANGGSKAFKGPKPPA